MVSKNLQIPSAIQNISVTLSSVVIAIFVRNAFKINTMKLRKVSLINKFSDTYNS